LEKVIVKMVSRKDIEAQVSSTISETGVSLALAATAYSNKSPWTMETLIINRSRFNMSKEYRLEEGWLSMTMLALLISITRTTTIMMIIP